jgi:hypothetical protein
VGRDLPSTLTAGEVHEPVLANKLAGLARQLSRDVDYGPPTTCDRKVYLDCGPWRVARACFYCHLGLICGLLRCAV